MKESQIELKPTLGYNYEVVNFEQIEYGIWDIGGTYEFLSVFIKTIPLKGFIYVIQPFKSKGELDYNNICSSRKEIHSLSNNIYLKEKVLVLIINYLPQYVEEQDMEEEAINNKKREYLEEIKEYIQWNELQYKNKFIYFVNVSEYSEIEQIWRKLNEYINDQKEKQKQIKNDALK